MTYDTYYRLFEALMGQDTTGEALDNEIEKCTEAEIENDELREDIAFLVELVRDQVQEIENHHTESLRCQEMIIDREASIDRLNDRIRYLENRITMFAQEIDRKEGVLQRVLSLYHDLKMRCS